MTSSSPIPLGAQVGPVTVGHVEQPDRVWICLDDPCNQLMGELETVQDSLVRLDSSKVRVGMVAATIFSEDGALYRAEVLEILPGVEEDEVEVRYLDYGNTEKVKRNSLFSLPAKLEAADRLAVVVALEGVDPRTVGNSEKNRAKIAKKLGKEGLLVELKEVGETLVAAFFAEGKKIKFTKSPPTPTKENGEQVETGSKKTKIEDKVENGEVPIPVEEVKSVKLVKSSEVTMVNQLPALKLLENVEITGQVQAVSPIGSVWFSPKWIHDDLDKLSEQLDQLDVEKKLVPVMKADICPGMLAAVRHTEYGSQFRARIQEVEGCQVKVKYIDYGDGEQVPLTNLYCFPPGLEMIAPGVAEIVLARDPPKIDPQRVLTEILVNEDEMIILKLETDESGAQVGRFFRGGKEVRFDGLVETRSVYSKDEVVAADDDVVVESEKILEPELNGKNDAAVLEVKKPEELEKIVQPEPSKDVAPASTSTKSPEKAKPADLFKMVEPRPLENSQEVAVYLGHVETVDMVWVSRLEDEEAIQALMADLTKLQETLTKATRKKAGAVFGAVYSDDGELYRVVLKDKAEPGKVTIHYMDFGNSDVVAVEALMNLPGHIAVVPSYAIPVHFSSGLEASPENLDLVRTTLDVDNLTVTVVDGKGHFKIDGKEVFGNPALAQVAEVEHDKSQVLVKPQEEEVPAEAVEVPKKNEPKPDENIEEEIAAAPPVVKDLIKKFSEKSPQEGEVKSGGKIAVAAGAVSQTDLVQPQKPQKIPNIVQVVREQTSPGKSLENCVTEPVAVSERKSWDIGEAVVAKFPGIGWKTAVVMECNERGVLISTKPGAASFLVDHADVKSSCVPTDALNLLERDLNRNVCQVSDDAATRGKKCLASSVTNKEKVNSWIDDNRQVRPLSNLGQKTLPASSELAKYSTTSSGSRHLQAVIATGNVELNRHILASLLESNISCYKLMTGLVSTYVLQKLITVLPCPLLDPLITEVLENFLQLCLDSVGCRVVQVLLEHSSQDQQLCLISLLSLPEVLVSLATSPSGTFVAQAATPLLAPHQDRLESLALNITGQISHTALNQAGSFFLQKLISILATHYPASPALLLIKDEIIQDLDQLVKNEPGSRVAQQTILNCGDMQLVLAVLRWLEENIQQVVLSKPAVHLALVVLEKLGAESNINQAWAGRLDKFILHFTQSEDLMVTAALHPTGYLLAKLVVSQLEVISEATRQEVLHSLATNVDLIKTSKTGAFVLRALE